MRGEQLAGTCPCGHHTHMSTSGTSATTRWPAAWQLPPAWPAPPGCASPVTVKARDQTADLPQEQRGGGRRGGRAVRSTRVLRPSVPPPPPASLAAPPAPSPRPSCCLHGQAPAAERAGQHPGGAAGRQLSAQLLQLLQPQLELQGRKKRGRGGLAFQPL